MSSFDFGPRPRPKLSLDRRRDQRAWVPQEASLTLAAASQHVCRVHNVSRKGAMLSVNDAARLPPVFAFHLAGDSLSRTARVRWRVATVAGVELVDGSAGDKRSRGEVMPRLRSRKNMCARGRHGTRNLITQLASALREFISPRYRPELHYMRGPGPACRNKVATRQTPSDGLRGDWPHFRN